MQTNVNLAEIIGIPQATVDRFLVMGAEAIYKDDEYMGLVRSLDGALMEDTLPDVREVYERHLSEFVAELQAKYRLAQNPMSAYTLGNWVVGMLRYPETTNTLLKMHSEVPSQMIVDGLPHLIGFIEDLDRGRTEWQRALCILSIPLMLHNK